MSFDFQYNDAASAALHAMQDVLPYADIFTYYPRVSDPKSGFPQTVIVQSQDGGVGAVELYSFVIEEDGELRTEGVASEGMYWVIDRVKPVMKEQSLKGEFKYPKAWADAEAEADADADTIGGL